MIKGWQDVKAAGNCQRPGSQVGREHKALPLRRPTASEEIAQSTQELAKLADNLQHLVEQFKI